MSDTVSDNSIDLSAPEYYFNREISHLQFNIRVLEQALDDSHPLLNRLMFLCIFSSNLDEFFEVRVADLKKQMAFSREIPGPDGTPPSEVLDQIYQLASETTERQYNILNEYLLPELEKENIRFIRRSDWNEKQTKWAKQYFRDEVQPVISPIGLDPAHPFPRLVNKSLNFIVELDGKDAFGRNTGMAVIPAPRSLPRISRFPDEICDGGDNYVFLSSMIHQFADELFPGMKVKGCYQFRLTRNADLSFDKEDVSDLASALEGELHARHYGDAVRLEVADNCPEPLWQFLLDKFNLTYQDLYQVNGPVNVHRLMSVAIGAERPELRYPTFTPSIPKGLKGSSDVFAAIRKSDQLLLHPFQSFTPVVDLVRSAAQDPDVLAIKQTLYRTGATSEIVNGLVEAARKGKEVTVVIELRARFDEEENLHLANRLQEAGCVVVYGVVGYKTHSKMMMIVRREGKKLKRYVHLGTGNYHAGNARLYTDYSLITCAKDLTEDVHKLFQQLTGMGKALSIKKIYHAPFTLHKSLLGLIAEEAKNAKEGKPARITIKVNSLTEPKIIQALYKASQAGVQVDCIVRGMCRLVPGIPGVSENISVRSIIGRFLEHTRVYYFENNDSPKVFASSADWMERNLLNRVETCFPIENAKWAKRLREELDLYLSDNCQSWQLQRDGRYMKNEPLEGEERISAQQVLLESLSA
ncbi:polyphosphate kinase 1 [Bermanella marisrubri]|uniref:Polyphosphate kinase n=1 Tax=Bermanella marisrubri TaxID=207949 RepID=Q1MZN7_9GAMM|nr:polyphosphate kinase 1 [Bermanella marisrubri]EAT11374.1 Polyphosphate kinase [Oceanobacter sp. RED65] [Bermanella marisrubri]QIZ85627.1 polyphosphate kinase 1 [Bermanella marisrubri]